jgi:hypothetical protein
MFSTRRRTADARARPQARPRPRETGGRASSPDHGVYDWDTAQLSTLVDTPENTSESSFSDWTLSDWTLSDIQTMSELLKIDLKPCARLLHAMQPNAEGVAEKEKKSVAAGGVAETQKKSAATRPVVSIPAKIGVNLHGSPIVPRASRDGLLSSAYRTFVLNIHRAFTKHILLNRTDAGYHTMVSHIRYETTLFETNVKMAMLMLHNATSYFTLKIVLDSETFNNFFDAMRGIADAWQLVPDRTALNLIKMLAAFMGDEHVDNLKTCEVIDSYLIQETGLPVEPGTQPSRLLITAMASIAIVMGLYYASTVQRDAVLPPEPAYEAAVDAVGGVVREYNIDMRPIVLNAATFTYRWLSASNASRTEGLGPNSEEDRAEFSRKLEENRDRDPGTAPVFPGAEDTTAGLADERAYPLSSVLLGLLAVIVTAVLLN